MLNDGSYCVDGGYRRGVYWIRQDDDQLYSLLCRIFKMSNHRLGEDQKKEESDAR